MAEVVDCVAPRPPIAFERGTTQARAHNRKSQRLYSHILDSIFGVGWEIEFTAAPIRFLIRQLFFQNQPGTSWSNKAFAV